MPIVDAQATKPNRAERTELRSSRVYNINRYYEIHAFAFWALTLVQLLYIVCLDVGYI